MLMSRWGDSRHQVCEQSLTPVFSFTRIVWKGIGCGGTNAHDDAALE